MIFKLLKSLCRSAGEGIKKDKELIKVKNRFPRTCLFIKKRLTPDEKMGLGLTVGTIVFCFFIYLFLMVLNGFFTQDVWIMTDLRILNVIQEFRTPFVNEIVIFLTTLAKKEVVIVGAVIVSIVLYQLKRWHYALSLAVSLIFGEIIVYFLKNSIERSRPPLDLAVLKETGFSFPSSHAFTAVAFYGMLSYFAFRGVKKKRFKIPILLFLTGLILLIGASRVYLGVHWASDVFAGLVAGVAWVNLIVTFFEIRRKSKPRPKGRIDLSDFKLKITAIALAGFWLTVIIFFYSQKSNEKLVQKNNDQFEAKPIAEHIFKEDPFMNFPRVSEKISGEPMEPVHIIIVGSQKKLFDSFDKIGWLPCDPLNGKSLRKIVYANLTDSPYPQAPGVPSLWNAIPNKISFEKPTEANSVKERHHIHFWDTGRFVAELGKEKGKIWFATAHFDMTISMKSSFFIPVHKIDPAIDNERQIIKENLEKANLIEKALSVEATKPSLGTNQSGDLFFTDGKAEVIFLKDEK